MMTTIPTDSVGTAVLSIVVSLLFIGHHFVYVSRMSPFTLCAFLYLLFLSPEPKEIGLFDVVSVCVITCNEWRNVKKKKAQAILLLSCVNSVAIAYLNSIRRLVRFDFICLCLCLGRDLLL